MRELIRRMRMLRAAPLFVGLTLLFSPALFGQKPQPAKPNLTGTWVIDRSKNKAETMDTTLVILHNDPVLKITSRRMADLEEEGDEAIYYTDGRGEKNSFGRKSKTQWSGDKLVIKSTQEIVDSDPDRLARLGRGYIHATETLQLSRDGLLSQTIVSDFTGPGGPAAGPMMGRLRIENRLVFRRAP